MLDNILSYERKLFFLVNHSHSAFLDSFMWLVSQTCIWIPLFITLLVAFIYKRSWKEWLPIIIVIALVLVCCDQFSSHLCKPFFQRFRPTHHPDFMHEVRTLHNYKGGLYGFISGHATNAFGFATITALLLKNRIYSFLIYTIAFIIAYSRVYLGVHFISDVVAGAMAGVFIGFVMYLLYHRYSKRVSREVPTALSGNRIKVISVIMISYMCILLLYCVR